MSKYTKEEFIEKARKKHGDKYDYSQVEYIDSQTKVAIICHEKDLLGNEHGVFWQMPYSHLQGFKCPRCNGRNKTTEQWIAEAKSVYTEGKYTYEKTNYTHARDKVIVTCKEHGDFITLPRDFLRGHGCPKCQMPKLEREAESALSSFNINFESQKHFEWLGTLSLDFYLPSYNVAIECQGIQHFVDKEYFKKRENLEIRRERDERKAELCAENGIELIYYTMPEFEKYMNKLHKYFTSMDDIVKYLNNNIFVSSTERNYYPE